MLKSILYLGLTALAVILTMIAPVWGAVFNISAYLMNPQLLVSEAPWFRFQMVAAICLIVSIVIHRPQPVARAGSEGTLLVLMWLYVGMTFLSAFWAVYSINVALEWAYDFSKTIIVSFLFVFVIRSRGDMRLVVWTCLVGVLHGAFMHVIGPKLGWIPESYAEPGYEPGAVIEYQGTLMILFIPLFILQGIYAPTWYGRVFCWLSLPLVLDSLVNTFRRGVFLSLIVEIAALLLFLPWRIKWKLLPLLAAGALLFLFRFTPATYWEKMETILTPREEASAASRLWVTEASMAIIRDYPMGVGYRNYPYVSPNYLPIEVITHDENGVAARSAHNTYFSVLCETGYPGFTLWFLLIVGTFLLYRRLRKTAQTARPDPLHIYAMGFEIGLYGWLAGGLTDSLHEMDPVYWFIAFGIILKRLIHQSTQETQSDQEEHEHDFSDVDDEPAPPVPNAAV